MAPYIYGVRHDIHIINLGKTAPMLQQALQAVRDVVAQNGRILFVGTKRQASAPIAEAAKRCGQHYINQRWLGGLLTNWNTIQVSIKTLRKLEEQLADASQTGFTKKELLSMSRHRDKLEASLGGIKDMGGRPDMLFVIDTNKEDLAIKEAQKLGIPIIAIVDSNCTTDGIDHPIPGNDDSTRAINLYCQLISDAVLDGIQASMSASGEDVGAREDAGEVIEMKKSEEKSEGKDEDSEEKKGRGNPRGKSSGKKAPVVTVKKSPGKKAAE